MRPAPFAYYAPSSVGDALDAISRVADPEDLKVLAGGQSLVPLLNLRLAQPGTLLNINKLEREWGSIEADRAAVRVGALVRQRAAERSAAVTQWCPLLAEALPRVAHVQIRTRGTIGGSIAHADPAAELPAVALALDARLHITGPRGERSVPASDFFHGFFSTALAPDELLSGIDFPRLPAEPEPASPRSAADGGDFAWARERSWACSVTTARASPRCCARWPGSSARPRDGSASPATTSPKAPRRRGPGGEWRWCRTAPRACSRTSPSSRTWPWPAWPTAANWPRTSRCSPSCSPPCSGASRRPPAGQLSGGERQMVAISIALARRPRVLLLDEPSLGLAPKVVESLMSAIATVARQFGARVLIVEQNIPAMLVVADRVVILKHGKLVADMRAADCPPAAQLWDYF